MVTKVLFFRPTLADGGADRVTVTVLRHLDRTRFAPSVVLMRKQGAFLDDLPEDVPVLSLESKRLATSGLALTRLLRQERPDVLFSTSSAANILAVAAFKAAGSRGRLVLSERNALYRGRTRTHAKQTAEVLLKRLSYRYAHRVTAVSEGVAEELQSVLHLAPSNIQVVYNPMVDDNVDQLAAQPVDHPWFSDGRRVVLAVGRLVEQKDYPTLLDAFALVRKEVDVHLFVLGDGPLRESLPGLADQRGLGGHVHFAGFDKNPFKYMARAGILMHASRAEGLPGSLIQTMACSTPVVSTDCDFGPREVIQNPNTDGILVPVGDANALAKNAIELLSDDTRRRRMGQAARESVQRFTVTESMRRYQEAISG